MKTEEKIQEFAEELQKEGCSAFIVVTGTNFSKVKEKDEVGIVAKLWGNKNHLIHAFAKIIKNVPNASEIIITAQTTEDNDFSN